MADPQLFTKMLRYVIKWGIFWRTKQSGPIPRDERGNPLFFLLIEGKVSQLVHYSKLWPFWSPWQEDKKFGNYNIAAKSHQFGSVCLVVMCQAVLTQTGVSSANASVKSKLQHAPPGIPRAFDTFAVPGRREFDYQSLPGGGEFDPHALLVGNLNCTLDFM